MDWNFLMDTVRDGRCVLLLGPEVAKTASGQSFRQAFAESLDLVNNPLIASYYDKEELFLFPDAIAKTRIYYQLKAFYQQDFQREFYGKLARLPLKLFINASPDSFLADTLGTAKHHFDYFHKTDPREEVSQPSLEKPLVYNLLGALEEEESLLMTHDDLYEFLEAMLARQHLPRKLTDEIFAARSLVFLGFNFDKWYVQLLLRLLKVHDVRSRFARFATEQKYNADTLSICEEQFKIEFINNGVDGFLDELYQRCETENLLRELSTAAQSPKEQILQHIEADQMNAAIDRMKGLFEAQDKDLFNEVIGISARHNRLKNRLNRNVIDEERGSVEMSRIRESLLELSEEII
ncbi:MAG: SIR2 family protein [Bacteroidota bacterium]